AIEISTIKRRNRAIRFGGVRHFDERKTPRAAGVAVGYQVDTVHLSVGLKERTDGRFSCCEIQIAYKDVFHIVVCLSIVRARLGRFGPRPGCCRTLKRLFKYSRTLPTGRHGYAELQWRSSPLFYRDVPNLLPARFALPTLHFPPPNVVGA